ncbi:type II secretion system F family protein [Azospirillum sp. sgz302134]
MARFEVRLIAAGKARSLTVDAPDAEAARAMLSGRGRILDVRRRRSWNLGRALDHNERHILFIRLAAMLESRVGLAEALRRMATSFEGRIRSVAQRLADAVEVGDDLPGAMERLPNDFPRTVVALVRAGGYGTGTPDALRNAARFETEMLSSSRDFQISLWVSVGHAVLGAVTMIATAHVLSPWMMKTELFRNSQVQVDVGWVELASDITTALVLAFLFGLLLLSALGVVGRRLAPVAVDRLMLALPVCRHLALGLSHYITLYKLSLLIGSGVGMDKALTLAADSANGGQLAEELRRAARAVAQGRSWTGPLRSIHATDRASLAGAESRAEMARTLHALALQHRDLYLLNVRLSQPVLRGIGIVFLGVAGVVLFGLTILPILQLADQLAKKAF